MNEKDAIKKKKLTTAYVKKCRSAKAKLAQMEIINYNKRGLWSVVKKDNVVITRIVGNSGAIVTDYK